MTDPTPDQWARLMSAVDQARADVTPSIDMSAFEVALEGEVRCDSKHRITPCTGPAKWSAPAWPCGCEPRKNVCFGDYEWVFEPGFVGDIQCADCGYTSDASEWRKGWWPL